MAFLDAALDGFLDVAVAGAFSDAEPIQFLRFGGCEDLGLHFARLGKQWHEHDKKNRERDKRPMLTINRMPAFIRQVVNDARQNKPSIRVRPVDDNADPLTAKIINGLIRNIEYTSNADVCYDTALEHAVDGGFGYFGIDIDYAR